MSFFDKLFNSRNRINKNENLYKPDIEGFSFRSSHLSIPKDQIRFVLFRECDKRGRKLLFDSNSVEKVLLASKENMCHSKVHPQSEKSDFIETNKTHGYKYKKPPNDVTSLGEMVFGSVAVVYKAENSCKIHCISSPKRLMFTTIVHAPFRRSFGSTISELNLDPSSGSSLASLTNILNQQLTSSSDSKLYKHEGAAQKYSSTYPWMRHNFPDSKVNQCCEISDVDYNLPEKSFSSSRNDLNFSKSFYLGQRTHRSEKFCSEKEFSVLCENNLSVCQKNSDCEKNSLSNYGSSGITSNESDTFSSISGSLSSLRRRWAHSYSTSLDSTTYEDTCNSPCKKRTKLGMALIIDLSNTLENEIEKLLFNHTIVIDSIMCKLQDSVELAYIRNERFVDLIYTAFLECQESIYELLTGGKYETPIWCSVLGESEDLEAQLTGMNLYPRSLECYGKLDMVNKVQIRFLNDFCDMLAKFDTKDTNFFISTLLTAVLTHHLSWVSSIAETDLPSSKEKLTEINGIGPYNPIWAQMNDLCGLLGSPLKSAKTVVTGPEAAKNQLATLIEILSYFIRCNNVVENIYEVDIEDIISNVDFESNTTTTDSFINSEICSHSAAISLDKKCFQTVNGKSRDDEQICGREIERVLLFNQSDSTKSESEVGLKRNKSCLFNANSEDSVKPNKLYPDIKDLAKSENIDVADLNYPENERTIFVDSFLSNEKLKEKIQKMIRVPSISVNPHAEECLSPDEGYNTIDSTKTDNFRKNKVQMERQQSAPESKKNIIFLLGENEELVNLQKKIFVNKSSFIDMEKEGLSECPCELSNSNENVERNVEGIKRTLNNSCSPLDRTFWVNHSDENVVKHSPIKDYNHRDSVKTPWVSREIKMPRAVRPCRTRRLEVSSVLGGVNQRYNSEQVIQGVLQPKKLLEPILQKDLFLTAHNPVLDKNVTEALCIVGDMDSWEVTVFSSNKSVFDYKKGSGVRVGMSQLVADMLESLLYLHSSSLSPRFCLLHIEKKLREIYMKSKTVAELLNSTELCSMDYLTRSLDIGINDVPLLLSVATSHSPQIAEKYGLTYS